MSQECKEEENIERELKPQGKSKEIIKQKGKEKKQKEWVIWKGKRES